MSFDLGGEGGRSFSFGPVGAQPGAHVSGTVLDMTEVQATNYETKAPEHWPNGDPKMQYRVTLQTDLRDPLDPTDDGKRDLYLDGRRRPNDNGSKSRLCAVLDAVREATNTTQMTYGGKLTVQWVSGMGFSGDPRSYQAWYEAPAMQLQPPGQGAPPVQQQPPVAAPPAAQQAYQAYAPPPPAGPPPTQVQQQGPPVPTPPEQPTTPPAAPVGFVNAQGVAATPETIAALRAAGVDPTAIYQGYDGSLG